MFDPFKKFESAVLPNGLTVYSLYAPERDNLAVNMIVHSGGEHDPVGQEGVAHFTEHMCSKNISLTREQIRSYTMKNGISANFGGTYYNSTRYSFFAPAKKALVKKMFGIFGEMLCAAKLTRFLERERNVIIGEFNKAFPLKFKLDIDMEFRKTVHNGCWLERSPSSLGNLSNIEQMSEKNLQDFYDAHYTPANITIVCVGAMTLSEITKLIEGTPFAIAKPGTRTPLPPELAPLPPPLQTRRVVHYRDLIGDNANASICEYNSTARIPQSENRFALNILAGMLREILDKEIRQKRAWTYSSRANWDKYRHYMALTVDVSAMPMCALDKIESVVEDCIASLAKSERLFNRFKCSKLATESLYDPNTQGICDDATSDIATTHRIESRAEYFEGMKNLTFADVTALIPLLATEKRFTTITCP